MWQWSAPILSRSDRAKPRPKTRSKGESPFWPLRQSRSAMVALHRCVGLVLAPLLVVIGVTGSISVFRTELDRMLNLDLWTTQSPDRHLPLSTLTAAITKAHPDQPLIALEYRPAPGGTLHAYLTPALTPSGKARPDEIFLDPGDAHELGARVAEGCCLNRRVLLPFIYRLHYSLAAGTTGLWIVGITALIWTLDCVNGLLLTLPPVTPPWRRGFWRGWKPTWQIAHPKNALRLFFDLHRALGLWLWILLLGMAISGVALALGPQIFQPVVRTLFPVAPAPSARPLPGGPRALTLDKAEALAAQNAQDRGWQARPAAMMLTHAPERALFYLFSDTGQIPAGFGSPLITIDLDTGAIVQASVPPEGKLGDLILQVQDPFHSGRLAGLTGRVLVCASGLVTALLSITGVLIWERKRRARRRALLKKSCSASQKRPAGQG